MEMHAVAAEKNTSQVNRRNFLGMTAAVPLMLSASSLLAAPSSRNAAEAETRSLDELYRAAVAKGGKLVVYAGGDTPNSSAGLEQMFKKRFPEIQVRIVTDLSKYHDTRIDQQLARGRLEVDVAHLQTLHDFERWKAEGQLLPYKPLDWDAISAEYKDPDGAFHAISMIAFSNSYNINALSAADAPRNAVDYLNPKLKGQICLTYPQDDDAVLFQFDRIVSAHGWDYMDRLMSQDVLWVRGTVPSRIVVQEGKRAATFTASGAFAAAANSPLRFVLPSSDDFLSWPQTAAIFREAPNKAAAKLYLSWMASRETAISRTNQWSVRRDVPIPGGYKPISDYNTDPLRFRMFMQDRARIERLRFQFEQVIGPVAGPNPTGVNGIYLVNP